ncbi:unnamed protein product [Symbiodinium sp. CCMP2592]|nr:unnamed protein product [Symbiodinium sp. CCMP2592]CAE7487514.1 unnamed protein product [Symbiodinium sp. CCMP2592]
MKPFMLPDAALLPAAPAAAGRPDCTVYMEVSRPKAQKQPMRTVETQSLQRRPDLAATSSVDSHSSGRASSTSVAGPAHLGTGPDALPVNSWLTAFRVAKQAQCKSSSEEVTLSPHKLRQMHWAIAEAKREQLRDWLAKSGRKTDISLAHDARDKIVAVRFTAVNEKLERKRGLLGALETHGGAEKYSDAILNVVKQFFSRGTGALDDRGVLDEASAAEFKACVTCVTADGAPYAQKACRLLSSSGLSNLRAIIRDRGHSIVGALKNAVDCDQEIRNFKEEFVSGPSSVAKSISFNAAFRERFEIACKAQQETSADPIPVMLSLRYGKARFQSQVDPERRLLLHLLGTCTALSKHAEQATTAEERQWAAKRLRQLTFERVALMACVSDAEEMTLTFCRQVEAEFSDPSLASACVDEFETQMRRLFLEGRIWSSENQGSWTRRILDQIKEAKVFTFGGERHGLSWPCARERQEVLARVHDRVCVFVKTILAGVRAEFPAQELMLRLESLSLAMWYSIEKNFGPTSACNHARKERVAQLEQKFRKLASCLHLPPEEAWLQFTHVKDNHDSLLHAWGKLGNNLEAWANVLARHKAARSHTRVDHLLIMVRFYAASLASTQGVESQFSEAERQSAKRVAQQSLLRLRDRLQISEMEESELVSNGVPQPLVKLAKRLYVEYFGQPRGAYGDKKLGTLARGVRRKCHKRSEATLIKDQRLATRKLSEKDTASGSMFGTRIPAEAKKSCWSECHTNLHRALAEKQAAKVAEATETHGQGLRPKTTAALKTKLHRGQRGRVTARQRRLLDKLSQPSKKPSLENARVYVLPKATAAKTELGPRQVLVDQVALADLVVVDNLNTPSWQAAEAMLRGKTICEGLAKLIVELSQRSDSKWEILKAEPTRKSPNTAVICSGKTMRALGPNKAGRTEWWSWINRMCLQNITKSESA